MTGVSVAAFGSYLPANVVDAESSHAGDAEDPLARSPLLRLPATRHHVDRDEHSAEMVARAARPMFDALGLEPAGNVDVLITNVLLPDIPITGAGEEVSARLGCRPDWVIDLHNGGCASFPYMLKLAGALIRGGGARTALLCNVQNTAGRVFAQPEIRGHRHAAIAGDGCGVAYVVAGDESPVLGVHVQSEPSSAADMGLALSDGRKYWEPGVSQIDIQFDAVNFKQILERGNRLVPEVVRAVCLEIGATPEEIDVLITNQPNRIFLRNWRNALGVPSERHFDTFDRFGNLYGAGVPISFAHALDEGRVRDGDLVVVAGFAHAGDFAAAAALRWHSRRGAA
jgi:3-oxoacyl-[acyl-carrier-protein] synthase-3